MYYITPFNTDNKYKILKRFLVLNYSFFCHRRISSNGMFEASSYLSNWLNTHFFRLLQVAEQNMYEKKPKVLIEF